MVRYDVRGHGASPLAAPFTFEDLADDLRGLLDELGIARAHVVGLSMGGVIARLLALRHPERIARLVLCSTLASIGASAGSTWKERAQRVREGGMAALVDSSLAHWFPAHALGACTPAVEHVRAMVQATSAEAYLAVCEAVARLDFFHRQPEIRARTLVLAGAEDPNLPTLAPQALASAISGAELTVFPGAGHFPNLDVFEAFNQRLLDFLR